MKGQIRSVGWLPSWRIIWGNNSDPGCSLSLPVARSARPVSDTILTSRFGREASGHLDEFLARYGRLDPKSRGVDTGVTILEDEDPRMKVTEEGVGF